MNATESKTSPQFWIWGFTFLFLLHAFGIFWFADRRELQPLWQTPAPFFYVSSGPGMDSNIAERIALQEPTLFALPHAHGFSGDAWLNFRPQVPTLNETSPPPEWLALPVEQLGSALHEYAATSRPSEEHLLASLRATRVVEVRIPDEPVITNTTIRVEGPLASRRLLGVPHLPSAAFSDVLRPTVVAVSVNGNGIVETSSLEEESGLNSADTQAVELARHVEFEPAPIRDARIRAMAPPTIGRLIFTWYIVTNTSPVTASAQ